MSRVLSGLEVLLGERRKVLAGKRFAVIANQASVAPGLVHAVDLLAAAFGEGLVRILAPEHGVAGAAQDMAAVGEVRDPRSGLPVVSLYGANEASLHPPAAVTDDLDAVVFDLQDVGARYYTFQATLAYTMAAARDRGFEVVVLDRPNPIGGVAVEGPGVAPGFDSFVGVQPIAVRHGLTVGELSRLYAAECGLACRLTVLPMQGWRREMWFDETGLTWVLPSPNMPTLDTATVYPGGCLYEGTNLSEGRGTTRPFELVGAPWLDPGRFAAALSELGLEGVVFRAASFRPTFHKYAGLDCGGVQIHVSDRARFQPFLAGVAVVMVARAQGTGHFDWRRERYEFVSDRLAFDLLTGSERLRHGIEAGESLDKLAASWRKDEERFTASRSRYLLY